MAKEFVRNIRNTKCIGKNTEPLVTNEQNDLLNDDKDVYIRNLDYYHCLTNSIQKINSLSKYIKVVKNENKGNVKDKIYIDLSTEELEKEIKSIYESIKEVEQSIPFGKINQMEKEIEELKKKVREIEQLINDLEIPELPPGVDLEPIYKELEKINKELLNLLEKITLIDNDINKRLGKKSFIEDKDLNNLIDTGLYSCMANIKNVPPSPGGYYVKVIRRMNDVLQLSYSIENPEKVYIRTKSNDKWGNWEILADGEKLSSVSRSDTIIVASSNSKKASRLSADYVIDTKQDSGKVINSIIDNLGLKGGSIKLLEGTYNFDTSINIDNSWITLHGCGKATRLYVNDNVELNQLILIDGALHPSNITIKDLFLGGGKECKYGIVVGRSFYVNIDNVSSESFKFSGFYTNNDSLLGYINIVNSKFYKNNTSGMSMQGNISFNITNCVITDNKNDGIYINNGYYGKVSNCIIRDNLNTGVYVIGIGENVSIDISNNNISKNSLHGIEVIGTRKEEDSFKCSIQNNYIHSQRGKATCDVYVGQTSAEQVFILNNIIGFDKSMFSRWGVYLADNSKRCVVLNNIINKDLAYTITDKGKENIIDTTKGNILI